MRFQRTNDCGHQQLVKSSATGYRASRLHGLYSGTVLTLMTRVSVQWVYNQLLLLLLLLYLISHSLIGC